MNEKLNSKYGSIVGQDEEELIRIFNECEQEIAKWEQKYKNQKIQSDQLQQNLDKTQKQINKYEERIQQLESENTIQQKQLINLNSQLLKQQEYNKYQEEQIKIKDRHLQEQRRQKSQNKNILELIGDTSNIKNNRNNSKSPMKKCIFNENQLDNSFIKNQQVSLNAELNSNNNQALTLIQLQKELENKNKIINKMQQQLMTYSNNKNRISNQINNHNNNSNGTQINMDLSINGSRNSSIIKKTRIFDDASILNQEYLQQIKDRIYFLQRIGKLLQFDKYDYIQQFSQNLQIDKEYNDKVIDQTQDLIIQDIQFIVQYQYGQNNNNNNNNNKIDQKSERNKSQQKNLQYQNQKYNQEEQIFEGTQTIRKINEQMQEGNKKHQLKYPIKGKIKLSQFVVNGLENIIKQQTKVYILILVEQNNKFIFQQKFNFLNDFIWISPDIEIDVQIFDIKQTPQFTINLVFQNLNNVYEVQQTIFKSYIIQDINDYIYQNSQFHQMNQEIDLLEPEQKLNNYQDKFYQGKLKYQLQFKI